MKPTMTVVSILLLAVILAIPDSARAQQQTKKPFEKVRLTVAAKALTYLPYYFGKSKGLFEKEGLDLEIIIMRPPIGVTALAAAEVDYTGSTGVSLRAAMKGLPVRALIFIQTRLSFSLIGQPGMTPAKIKNVAVSGIGSLAHYGAQTVLKRLGRDGPGDKINYIATNTTANSYAALTGKAADAVILTAPYTSMATLAGYVDLGDTFDVRDVQGGLVGRMSHIQNHRGQIKAVLRAVLRSNEMILKNDAEVIPFIQKEFGLEQNVAADSYRQIKQVLNADGDIEEPVLKSILNKIRQESGIAAEIPVDRLVDLSMLREARADLRKK